MKVRARWLICLLSAPIALFLLWSGLASGQGPVLTILPTPTPAVPLPERAGAASAPDVVAQAKLPDLVVVKIQTLPAIPLVGQSTIISVTIKNQGQGNVPTGNNFLTDLYIDPPFNPVVNYHQIISPTLGLPWGAQYFWVPAGGTYVFTTTWVFTDVKTVDIWALVDSSGVYTDDTDGIVTEADEGNNAAKASVSILTPHSFTDATHKDFMTNMASTLDNSDPSGALYLGLFEEPAFFDYPFANAGCVITTSSVSVSDYNLETPDTRLNAVTTGRQVNPYLIADGKGVVIAVWEDGRNGDLNDRDIYLRYSTNEGQTWGGEVRVNEDPPGANQLNPVAALSKQGDLLVAWQDNRNGDFDIYTQRFQLSGVNLTRVGSNMQVGGTSGHVAGDQINPDIAVSEDGGFHVVWQDSRNGNYDIFTTSYAYYGGGNYMWTNVRRVNDDPNLTQQSNPAINVLDWFRVTDVEYTIGPGPDFEVTVTEVVSQPVTVLAVIWEDYRKSNSDIAIALSLDGGETFSYDRFINDDAQPDDPPDPLGPDQLDPDVTLTKNKAIATVTVPLPNGRTTQVEVETPVTSIYTVWQDYRNGVRNPDIYYSVSQFGVEQVGDYFNPELTLGANEKINSEDSRSWQTAPVWQRDPALVAVPCGGEAKETEWNVFITWADGRNYDSANYDIYFTAKSTCPGMPEGLGDNRMLNDGIHLYDFDASNPSYDDYSAGSPPPGSQVNPTIAADIQTNWPFVLGGYLYVAWEDDRAGDPQVHKDISFARSNLTNFNHSSHGTYYGAGSQISNILDSRNADTIWYTIDWSAMTAVGTYLTVQTRLGNTITDVLASDWYPTRFPYQPQPGDCSTVYSGAPLSGYDAPGQHIEDSSGSFWPQARYIQYRVNFFTRISQNTPVLDSLTVYFVPDADAPNPTPTPPPPSGHGVIYLPIIIR
jgi:hypothetical protein